MIFFSRNNGETERSKEGRKWEKKAEVKAKRIKGIKEEQDKGVKKDIKK
jgi:hypothetical protein